MCSLVLPLFSTPPYSVTALSSSIQRAHTKIAAVAEYVSFMHTFYALDCVSFVYLFLVTVPTTLCCLTL